jgi:hypothetical protein
MCRNRCFCVKILAEISFLCHCRKMDSKQVVWNSAMSSYMLTHLSNVVANGTRTSIGFKKAHLTACAKAMNDHFKLSLTPVQISNHKRTWREVGKDN